MFWALLLFISYDDSYELCVKKNIVAISLSGTWNHRQTQNSRGIARIVPQITGKETLCSCFQAETSKENVLVRLLRCCSHLQGPRDICGLFYVHFQTSPC